MFRVSSRLLIVLALAATAMVPPVEAGVLFTMDPVSQDPSRIVIEAACGLGENVVAHRFDHSEDKNSSGHE